MRVWVLFALGCLATGCAAPPSSALHVGASAPGFSLRGTDGKVHTLADYAGSPILAVVFTCNHCAEAQRAEAKVSALARAYRDRGVTVIAINPDRAADVTMAALAYSDVNESLDDMKTRDEFAQLGYAYLSDGDTQAVTRQYGVTALPQMFIFDRERHLQYQGRVVDDTDARAAIEALLGGRPVPVAETHVDGCPPTGPADASAVADEQRAIASQPATVDSAGADVLTALRRNGTGKLLLVNFWATWCGPCVTEFPDLEMTYQMYRTRGLGFVAVSTNDPQERPAVVDFLQKHHASHRNLQFATPDVYGLEAAFDPKMPASVPFTLLLADNGDVLYQELGVSDIPKLRRAILANLPEDRISVGLRPYWTRP